MGNWWEKISNRERYIVIVAGFIGLIISVDSLVVEQLRVKSELMDEKVEQAQQDLMWMADAVHRLPLKAKPKQAINPGRVVSYVDTQITKLKLKSHMQQMTPIGEKTARVRLNNLKFSQLLTFFNAIDSALQIDEVRLTPADTDGIVNATLVVTKG